MTCREVLELVEPLAAGEAVGEPARAHLETCPSCAAALATARRIEVMLGERGAPPAPDGFTAAVLHRIRRERWQTEQRFDRVFNAAMAAAVLLLVSGVALLFNIGEVIDVAGAIASTVASAGTNAVASMTPVLGTYVAAAGLLLSGLFMWFWAEGA